MNHPDPANCSGVRSQCFSEESPGHVPDAEPTVCAARDQAAPPLARERHCNVDASVVRIFDLQEPTSTIGIPAADPPVVAGSQQQCTAFLVFNRGEIPDP